MTTVEVTEDTLARAIHDTEPGMFGCGWVFDTVLGGVAYCPCRARAQAILKAIEAGPKDWAAEGVNR